MASHDYIRELACGGLRCQIAAHLGAASPASGWATAGAALHARGATELTQVRQAGSYPLVPFSNRVAHATSAVERHQPSAGRQLCAEPHAIHGVGWQRPWEVLEADDTFAMLSFEHRADASWPFAFDCFAGLSADARRAGGDPQRDQPVGPAGAVRAWAGIRSLSSARAAMCVFRPRAAGRWGRQAAHRTALRNPGWIRGLRHAGRRPLLRRLAWRVTVCSDAANGVRLGSSLRPSGGVHQRHARLRGHRTGQPCQQRDQHGRRMPRACNSWVSGCCSRASR
jgi:hypothetical protein